MVENKQIKNEGTVVVRGRNLPISTKKAMAICKLLKGKKIESSIKFLEEVAKMKKGISLDKREVLKVKKGPKHPIKTIEPFVKMLKNLNANASVKGIDASKLVLMAKADRAPRPQRPGARLRKFKRTHVLIEGRVEETKK